MKIKIGEKSKFQIIIRNVQDDGLGNFSYYASNQLILDSERDVSVYDEIFGQIVPRIIPYGRKNFLPLANQLIKKYPFIIESGKNDLFEHLSTKDRLLMIDTIHGAKPNNPLLKLKLDDSIYDIPIFHKNCFPVPLLDRSSSRYGLIGPYLYQSNTTGKIVWENSGVFFDVDIDIDYLYSVYWKTAEIIDQKIDTWKFPRNIFDHPFKKDKQIPVTLTLV